MDYNAQYRTDRHRVAVIGGTFCLSIAASYIAVVVIMMSADVLNTEVSQPSYRPAVFIGVLIVTLFVYLYVLSLFFIPLISVVIGAFSHQMQQRYGRFMRRTIGRWRPYKALCRSL